MVKECSIAKGPAQTLQSKAAEHSGAELGTLNPTRHRGAKGSAGPGRCKHVPIFLAGFVGGARTKFLNLNPKP